jgi:N-6 DNA Methylase
VNEWGFAAEIKSWWDEEFFSHPAWRFSRCEVEQTEEGDAKRSDLSVMTGRQVRLSGELRLPDHPVANPWHPDNLSDAIEKATLRGARWTFTSDCNVLLLIDTQLTGPATTRVVQQITLISFKQRNELDSASFLARVAESWREAIREIAPVVAGLTVPRGMAADEVFVNSLRALLSAPVAAIRDELNRRRLEDDRFAKQLVTWMVDEQGWTHAPQYWEAEVLRAAQLTAYVFTTRLMFYEALRRSNPTISPLSLPTASANVARANFKAYFDDARVQSGDYETLFSWDAALDFALNADESIAAWRRVIAHLALFGLANISYDVLGKMFERLIDPHERYEWGQHYTSPDVVDLMLSFAIPDGDGKVLDPAAGGGTFLVRAYVRKRVFDPGKSHEDLLSELYGFDVSAFAASLATVNLAVRQLRFSDNYPLVAARSFFLIDPAQTFMAIPSPNRLGLGHQASVAIAIDAVRAVVCNPPYIRLHELGLDRQKEASSILGSRSRRVPVPKKLPGLSNYHVYFWLHGAQFLEPGGRLVLITAGEWLDSDYGAVLQEWLLDHFRIECLIESFAEPWFSEARVGTVVVVAQLDEDEQRRASNEVRFILLRKPLSDLYGTSDTDEEHIHRVDALRQRLVGVQGATGEGEEFDWSVIRQEDLRALGLSHSDAANDEYPICRCPMEGQIPTGAEASTYAECARGFRPRPNVGRSQARSQDRRGQVLLRLSDWAGGGGRSPIAAQSTGTHSRKRPRRLMGGPSCDRRSSTRDTQPPSIAERQQETVLGAGPVGCALPLPSGGQAERRSRRLCSRCRATRCQQTRACPEQRQ